MVRYGYLFAFVALALAAGCTRLPHERLESFVEAEYAPYAKPGTAQIDGQAFIKTHSGEVKFAAANWVYLTPLTSYSAEWFRVRVLNNRRIEPPDARLEKYQRRTKADGEGRFQFKNLPAGEYYLFCPIRWKDYTEIYAFIGFPWTKGGNAYGRVTVREGETAKVLVTR